MAEASAIRAEAEVRLWGETVGALVELEGGRILFEYAEEFRQRELEISPIHLPTSLAGPQAFDELRRRAAFEGLPGVLADALPDAFGHRVIRAYYASLGRDEPATSPVQRLLYVGERTLGALTVHPAVDLPTRRTELESLEVQALAHDARRIVRDRFEVTTSEIYRIGSSAGGKRPKAIVHYDPVGGGVRSGALQAEPGEIPCILKFDGVGGGDPDADRLGPPSYHNRIEAAYSDMARAAGLDTAEVRVLDVDGYAHLLVTRFDLRDGARVHQHTFGGMVHADYNEPGSSSYEEYFRTILRLGMAYDALGQAYRRMVFNVLAVNQDDHVKNLSFHMDAQGTWSLTPAYDLTFAHGSGWTAAHQMRIRDKRSAIRDLDLVAVGEEFGVKRPERIIDEARSAVADWERFAAAYGVPAEGVRTVRRELDERARDLASS